VLQGKRRLGEHLAARVNAGHIRAHVVGRSRDLVIAEFPVHNTGLAGKTIRQTTLRELTGLTIVAYWDAGVLRPAHADARLGPYSVVVVIGNEEQMMAIDLPAPSGAPLDMASAYPRVATPSLLAAEGADERQAIGSVEQRRAHRARWRRIHRRTAERSERAPMNIHRALRADHSRAAGGERG
jgi:hypothetical protein